jgi:hypothetical protein
MEDTSVLFLPQSIDPLFSAEYALSKGLDKSD